MLLSRTIAAVCPRCLDGHTLTVDGHPYTAAIDVTTGTLTAHAASQVTCGCSWTGPATRLAVNL